MEHYLSIDIGGTYIKYALFHKNTQQLMHKQKTAMNAHNQQALYKQMIEIIDEAMEKYHIIGIGISTAGIVDREKGRIDYAGPTIPFYQNMEWKSPLMQYYNLPVYIENDVNAALLGERWKGSAMNENHIYCITIGTGIGGAYYHHELMDGYYQQANSVGYLLYDSVTKTNFEQRAATSALRSMIKQVFGEATTPENIFQRAKSGEQACISMINDWAKQIAAGLAQIILLFDPKCLLIGGGISQQGDYLLNYIKKEIIHYVPQGFIKTKLKMAKLYNDAALYGAIYPFFQKTSTY